MKVSLFDRQPLVVPSSVYPQIIDQLQIPGIPIEATHHTDFKLLKLIFLVTFQRIIKLG